MQAKDDQPGGLAAPRQFGRLRAAAHWVMALLILFMLAGGLLGLATMSDADPAKIDGLKAHVLFGLGTLAALLIHFAMALATPRPAKAPTGSAMLDALATFVRWALPLCACVMIASGIATVQIADLGPVLFGGKAGGIPETVQALPSFKVHASAARALLGLIVLHVAGSLYHQLVLRDGLISRMSVLKRRA